MFEALEFMRTHWHRRADPALAEAKARWRERLSTAWPLAGYTELAERLREAEAACGVGLQTRFLSKADPLLMKQIQDALTGNRP